jgi:hypothetical protein
MGYSGLGIGADDLSRVMGKEKVWQKHGLDVKAIYFASGSLMAQAMMGGEIQTSDSDVPILLNVGVSGVFDIKIIAVTINRIEHSFVVRNGINTTDDLRGQEGRCQPLRFGLGYYDPACVALLEAQSRKGANYSEIRSQRLEKALCSLRLASLAFCSWLFSIPLKHSSRR